MASKPGVLRNMRVKRVALVDAGANFDRSTGDGAHIMLYKRDLTKADSIGSVHADSPDWDADDADEYEKATLDAAGRRAIPDSSFLAVWTDDQGKKHRKLPVHDAGHLAAARGRIDSAQMPADVKAAAHRKLEHLTSTKKKETSVAKSAFGKIFERFTKASAETDVAKRQAEIDALIKEADAMGDANDDGSSHLQALQDMHKNLGASLQKMGPGPHPAEHPYHKMAAIHANLGKMLKEAGCEVGSDEPGALVHPTVTKAMTELEKRNTELEKRLTDEIEKRERGELLVLLKSFKSVPINIDEKDANNDIAKFAEMKKKSPVEFERMMAIFKATDEQLKTSELFKHAGVGGDAGPGSAYAEAEAKAELLMAKASGKDLTKEAAIAKVFEENPKLYTRYVAEQQ